NEVFISLYKKGYIYRGLRIINWDVEAKTALSNIEVIHEETKGHLYYFKYPFTNNPNEGLVVATTRPETMFADQALMVHPDDKRYQKYIGKEVYIPGTKTKIKIIKDDYVDMDFGTGVVKVTPAHDPNDYEVGIRHNLEMPLCMNEDGLMNELSNQYKGLDRFTCRKQLVKDLKELNLVVKIEDHLHNVGFSERTGVMVEPRLSLQWFVEMKKLTENTINTNDVEFIPKRFHKTLMHWLNNIEDWTISRQLWWGHRIPAWYKDDQVLVQIKSPGKDWVQDEDVLDTWFSSALWPFSTLNWPNTNDPLFKRYYPTNLLVTGYDIIFFWVARMMIMATEFTEKDPFKEVLLHGLIRDSKGRKMSKSLNNGIDPMDVIAEYGIDALRYFIVSNSAPGLDTRYDELKVKSSWNFINKLWNITRFILLNIEDINLEIDESKLNHFDKWILTRLKEVIDEANNYYDKYELNEVSLILHNFIWDEFASYYVEISKISLNNDDSNNTKAVLLYVLTNILKLMHPFIPFVTEELFQKISNEPSIMVSNWPESTYRFTDKTNFFGEFKDVLVKTRNIRAEYNIPNNKPLELTLEISNDSLSNKFKTYEDYLIKLTNLSTLNIINKNTNQNLLLITGKNVNLYLKKDELIDKEKEIKILNAQKINLTNEIKRSKQMLSNENFLKKAPKEKVLQEKEKYESYLKQYEDVLNKLKTYDK
ncbi:MAG: valine--tRNA ligase, partial [Acholeplasmataceae bacterium]